MQGGMLARWGGLLMALTGACLAPPGTPARANEPGLQFVFEEWVSLGAAASPGATAMGGRNLIPITGGHFSGPGADGKGISGTVVPGGWDWQLRRADGCTHIHADYMLKTGDGALINIVNDGVSCRARDPMAVVRTHPVFEAPLGRYDWLSQGAFVGTLDPGTLPDGSRAVHIRIYKVT